MNDQQACEVAQGLREGKTESWETLYKAYFRRVWDCVARLMGPQSADVADVVQETFLAAARSARTYDARRGSLWTWLSRIARQHVALHYRTRQRQDRIKNARRWLAEGNRHVIRWLENRQETPSEALEAAELTILIRAALVELPPDYETLLVAKYLEGASVEQIAADQDCSSTAIRSKLARARRAFRRAFDAGIIGGGRHES